MNQKFSQLKSLSKQEILEQAQGILSDSPNTNSKRKSVLQIEGQIMPRGIRILVGGNPFDVVYPKRIWEKYPSPLKKLLIKAWCRIFPPPPT